MTLNLRNEIGEESFTIHELLVRSMHECVSHESSFTELERRLDRLQSFIANLLVSLLGHGTVTPQEIAVLFQRTFPEADALREVLDCFVSPKSVDEYAPPGSPKQSVIAKTWDYRGECFVNCRCPYCNATVKVRVRCPKELNDHRFHLSAVTFPVAVMLDHTNPECPDCERDFHFDFAPEESRLPMKTVKT